jgi:hypothetical protein
MCFGGVGSLYIFIVSALVALPERIVVPKSVSDEDLLLAGFEGGRFGD